MTACLYKSLGGEYATSPLEGYVIQWQTLIQRPPLSPLDSSPDPYTGDLNVFSCGNSDETATITIRQTEPLPLTLLALVTVWDVEGR